MHTLTGATGPRAELAGRVAVGTYRCSLRACTPMLLRRLHAYFPRCCASLPSPYPYGAAPSSRQRRSVASLSATNGPTAAFRLADHAPPFPALALALTPTSAPPAAVPLVTRPLCTHTPRPTAVPRLPRPLASPFSLCECAHPLSLSHFHFLTHAHTHNTLPLPLHTPAAAPSLANAGELAPLPTQVPSRAPPQSTFLRPSPRHPNPSIRLPSPPCSSTARENPHISLEPSPSAKLPRCHPKPPPSLAAPTPTTLLTWIRPRQHLPQAQVMLSDPLNRPQPRRNKLTAVRLRHRPLPTGDSTPIGHHFVSPDHPWVARAPVSTPGPRPLAAGEPPRRNRAIPPPPSLCSC